MKAIINKWNHPGTGETRRYIDNWQELVGIEIDRYKTGNIRRAFVPSYMLTSYYRDTGLSNRRAYGLADAKVYLDGDSKLHMRLTEELVPEKVAENLIVALTADGITVNI